MNGAGPGGNEKGPALVFLKQAGGERGRIVADGVVYKSRSCCEFLAQGKHLPQERIGRVSPGHAADIGPGSEEGESVGSRAGGLEQCGWKIKGGKQLRGVADGQAEFVAPGGVGRSRRKRRHIDPLRGCPGAHYFGLPTDRFGWQSYNSHRTRIAVTFFVGQSRALSYSEKPK